MAVTLEHDVGIITLPSPKPGANVRPIPNQTVARSAAGTLRVFKHGPTRYEISRTFEALSESQISALMEFLQAAGWSAATLIYRYRDPRDKSLVTENVRVIAEPTVTRAMLNLHDVTLQFETDQHPDHDTDRAAIGLPAI